MKMGFMQEDVLDVGLKAKRRDEIMEKDVRYSVEKGL